jgi:hypothetical protein
MSSICKCEHSIREHCAIKDSKHPCSHKGCACKDFKGKSLDELMGIDSSKDLFPYSFEG